MSAFDLFFLAAGITLVGISRKSLLRPDTHGFYRLFVFESIVLLCWLNLPHWGAERGSLHQMLSSLLQFGSAYLALHSFYLLWVRGGRTGKRKDVANFTFENTERLVDSGLYGYIRHPMYGSLLLLIWGLFFKNPGDVTGLVAVMGTAALVLAAKVEERENIRTFGAAYRDYIQRTRMFIPFVV
jgi:protein-S-isoprenylcysteine O-methyltransferase Ste14